jgi:BirA family transcriptional regulator, biotin operon repressor / biotin---[acetyl-CoA-carboxylase] ligase
MAMAHSICTWQLPALDFQEQFYYHQNAMRTDDIRTRLTTQLFGKEIHYRDALPSTNIFAKALLQNGAIEGALVITDHQTDGHGRSNRKWYSEPSKNLTFSVIVQPTIAPERLGGLSLYAGLSVAEAIEEIASLRPTCKWPNDILLNGKKICGILSEAIFEYNQLKGVVIGIGINVNQRVFPAELQSTASSLTLETNQEYDCIALLSSVLERMERNYQLVQSAQMDQVFESWKQYTTMFGQMISVHQTENIITGIAARLDDDGGLILLTSNGEQKILAGDITI